MSMESVVSFWKKVDTDAALQRHLDPKGEGIPALQSPESLEWVSGVARKNGFAASSDEFRAAELIKQFWMKVDRDSSLQKELLSADGMKPHEALQLIHRVAKKSGYDVTPEQIDVVSRAQAQAAGSRELKDDELEAVAGGMTATSYYYYYYRAPGSIGQQFFLNTSF
jgi:predicted ribosomally synthesized peptide with nif11-like leader